VNLSELSEEALACCRRKGKSPITVVAGERFRTKKKAEKEARSWNKAYKSTNIKFMVRRYDWRRKSGYP